MHGGVAGVVAAAVWFAGRGGRLCSVGRGLRSDGLLKFLFLNLRCCQTITESLHAPGR